MGASERVEGTLAEARALAHPLRLRIIRLTFDEDLTNKEIAAKLDKDPATVLHHVRILVDQGFLEPLEPRRGTRGSRERPYRSTGKSWSLDTDATGIDLNQAMVQAFVGEVAGMRADQTTMSRLALRLSKERREELAQRLRDVLIEAHSWPDDPDGERFAIFTAVYDRE